MWASRGAFLFLLAGWTSSCGGGDSAANELGLFDGGQHTEAGPPPSGDPPSGGRSPIGAIALGNTHGCVLAGGALWCWGSSTVGANGPGLIPDTGLAAVVPGAEGGQAAIFAARDTTCMTGHDGVLRCLGSTDLGLLGATYDRLPYFTDKPVPIDRLASPVSDVAIGGNHICTLIDGQVWCWGRNDTSQLADAVEGDSGIPVRIASLPGRASAIAAAGSRTCAIIDGGAFCWGGGRGVDRRTPTVMPGLESGVSAIALGTPNCAIRNGGAVCWGGNRYGQLGNGANVESEAPVAVLGLEQGVSAIRVGNDFACALVAGSVQCWGNNKHGALGNGTTTASNVPVAVSGLTGVTALALGSEAACAIVMGMSVHCWGNNSFERLGVGNRLEESATPVMVEGLP